MPPRKSMKEVGSKGSTIRTAMVFDSLKSRSNFISSLSNLNFFLVLINGKLVTLQIFNG